MVSDETGLPVWFEPGQRAADGNIDPATTRNVRWVAQLGNTTYGRFIVAAGTVFVGTNNEPPRDPRLRGDRGVLMCFDEKKTGEFLWQLVVPKLDRHVYLGTCRAEFCVFKAGPEPKVVSQIRMRDKIASTAAGILFLGAFHRLYAIEEQKEGPSE